MSIRYYETQHILYVPQISKCSTNILYYSSLLLRAAIDALFDETTFELLVLFGIHNECFLDFLLVGVIGNLYLCVLTSVCLSIMFDRL